MIDRNARIVYSTASGRTCPTCGWPANDCKCSSRSKRDTPLPTRIVAKLRMEKKGRSGKTVTVVYDLPQNETFLKELAGELKRACGAGGSVVENTVEVQGDLRDRIRALLTKKDGPSRADAPGRAHVDRDRGDQLRIEPHRVTASGGELILWVQLANPQEYQLAPFQSDELHPAKPDSGVAARVIGIDDLVGRQRHPEALGEDHECPRWTVADNRKL
jgi:translation initiation factor 1